ncbi:hypothetical protein GJ744_007158 [Endocarpon pusillum]|uniref:Uncharacterized protein n=1 Tax=Endocarpon pusillum TaxID=364733 RepID=A0A8H7E4C8_9EURO|nr:hypothetical protein GJ744_007158 [Endocarpon pusillum]
MPLTHANHTASDTIMYKRKLSLWDTPAHDILLAGQGIMVRHRTRSFFQIPDTRAADLHFVQPRTTGGDNSYRRWSPTKHTAVRDPEDYTGSRWRFLWMVWPRAGAGPLAPA